MSNGESTCAIEALPAGFNEEYFLFPVTDPPWIADTMQLYETEVQFNFQPVPVLAFDTCMTTGIVDAGATEIPMIFPNPADKFLEFTMPAGFKMIKYEVFNLNGAMIFQSKTLSHVTLAVHKIDLQSIQEGIYALKITCDNHVFTEKFVVEH